MPHIGIEIIKNFLYDIKHITFGEHLHLVTFTSGEIDNCQNIRFCLFNITKHPIKFIVSFSKKETSFMI